MEFIGQTDIINYVNTFTLDTLPRSILFIGEKGCGKHTICNKIISQINIPFIDITENISLDTVQEMYGKPSPYLYLVDINKISEKDQNTLLKILEEPYNNTYLILLCDNINHVLPTIKNRCARINFKRYSKEDLITFIPENEKSNEDIILSLASTPGQVIDIYSTAKTIMELAVKIVDKIGIASLPNALTLSNKLRFKEEKTLLDPIYVLRGMNLYLIDLYAKESNEVYYKMLKRVSNCIRNIEMPKVNKKYIFEKLIVELWKISRSEK